MARPSSEDSSERSAGLLDAVEAERRPPPGRDRDADMARCLEEGLDALPPVGADFLGFRLIAELGRGAFSRVYLARQADLAHRHVALKISPVFGEPQLLAQLQHTNIVPIYSVHAAGPLQAVCMPYFGPTTLADLLKDVRGRGALPRSGRELANMLRRTLLAGTPPLPDADSSGPTPACRETLLKALEGKNYVQAVLWLAVRLADGLSHAHERGILHRDLKPANVLLGDDGEPMLLDFNLSEDVKRRDAGEAAPLGGTLPYMPPEVLDAMICDEACAADARSDLYSFGVILYELLTGRLPTPVPPGPPSDAVRKLLADRRRPAPLLRPGNREVSPAVESVVRHCLEPEPAQRYQTAAQLREDLQRQLEDRPLRYAPEPSLRERLRKWRRRHPRVASPATLGAVLALLIAVGVGLLAWSVSHEQRVGEERAKEAQKRLKREKAEAQEAEEQAKRKTEALALLNSFRDEAAPFTDMEEQRHLAFVPAGKLVLEPEDVTAEVSLGRRALARYGVPGDADWMKGPQVQALPTAEQAQLRREMSGVLYILAQIARVEATRTERYVKAYGGACAVLRSRAAPFVFPDLFKAVVAEAARRALELNSLAEACRAPEPPSHAFLLQRAALTRLTGQSKGFEELLARAQAVMPGDARDFYEAACAHAAEGRFEDGLALAEAAREHAPLHFGARLLEAACQQSLGKYASAANSFTVALALRDKVKFAPAYLARGTARLQDEQWRGAKEDFQTAIGLHVGLARAHELLALALEGLAERHQALHELDKAIEAGLHTTAVHYRRATFRKGTRQDDHDEVAVEDVRHILQERPNGERALLYRGLVRPDDQSEQAIADLDAFLREEPNCLEALLDKSKRLATAVGQQDAAHDLLNDLVRRFPKDAEPRMQRAMFLARSGDLALISQAPGDAEAAFRLDQSPRMHYRVAVVYALTLRNRREDNDSDRALKSIDSDRALKMLAYALRMGYRERRDGRSVSAAAAAAADANLAGLRAHPDFRPVLEAALRLGSEPAPRMRAPKGG